MKLAFLNELTHSGYRIFSTEDAREIVLSIGYADTSVSYILKSLIKEKAIRPLMRGVYAIEDHIMAGSPLHKCEIASFIAKEGAVSCWSAMSIHELTDQVLSTVFVLIPHEYNNNKSVRHYAIDGYGFTLIQTHVDHFWGMEYKRFGETKVRLTDLERTLLDGLIRPHYCGGFREVLNAYLIAKDRIDVNKICVYAQKCAVSVKKRLGYVLNRMAFDISPNQLGINTTNYFDKLDPSSARCGKQNNQWMLLENI